MEKESKSESRRQLSSGNGTPSPQPQPSPTPLPDANVGVEASPLALGLTAIATPIPAATDMALQAIPEGIIIGNRTQGVNLIGAQASAYVGAFPAFFGSEDQLFFSFPVFMQEDKSIAAWFFADIAIEPKVAAAKPSFVTSQSETFRPDALPDSFVLPDNSASALLIASERQIWYRGAGTLSALQRTGNSWRYYKYDLTAIKDTIRTIAIHDTGLSLLLTNGELRTLQIADNTLKSFSDKIPNQAKAGDCTLLRLREHDALICKSASFSKPIGKSTWFPVANVKLPADFPPVVRLSRSFADIAYLVAGEQAYAVSVKDSAAQPVDPSTQMIPEPILAILTKSCDNCHTVRSNNATYSGVGFDHHQFKHWQNLVAKQGETGTATLILGDMCNRGLDSSCKSDAGVQNQLRNFIQTLATAPQRNPTLGFVQTVENRCRACHIKGSTVDQYAASADKFDPLNVQHWQRYLGLVTKEAASTHVKDVMCARGSCNDADKALLDSYLKAF